MSVKVDDSGKKQYYERSDSGQHYRPIQDPDGINLNGNAIKTIGAVIAVMSALITGVFAFTQKADRSEIIKLQKQIEDQRVELVTVKTQNNIALQGIKEIRDDFKEIRRDIKEIRKTLRGVK